MFYDAIENRHGLRYDPYKTLIAPRPIGWISTVDLAGRVNLAPYSYFNALSESPHIVAFSSIGWKHSLANVEATGEWVCNLATYPLREAVNASSAPVEEGADEMRLVGLTPAPSRFVRPPRVAESPVALECRHLRTIQLSDLEGREVGGWLVMGQVVGIHIDEACIVDGAVDITRLRPIARLGGPDYAVVDEVFSLKRPKAEELMGGKT